MSRWRFENNILYASDGSVWKARSGGLDAGPEVEGHKKTKNNQWLPIPHDNSLYREGKKLSCITYKICKAYTVEEILMRKRPERGPFIRDISDKKHSFCRDDSDAIAEHRKKTGHESCMRFGDWKSNGFNQFLSESIEKGHTWFVPLENDIGMGRLGFGIHPDGGEWGTHGCIGVIADDTSNLFALLKKSVGQKLEVIGSAYWWSNPPHSNP